MPEPEPRHAAAKKELHQDQQHHQSEHHPDQLNDLGWNIEPDDADHPDDDVDDDRQQYDVDQRRDDGGDHRSPTTDTSATVRPVSTQQPRPPANGEAVSL